MSLGGDKFGEDVHLLDVVGRVLHCLQLEHRGFGEVTPVAGFPLVMLLDQDRSSEPEEGGGLGEHAYDVGAAFDLFVHSFQRVRGPDLAPMPLWKSGEGKQVGSGVGEHRRDLRVGSFEHGGDLGELCLDVFPVGLGEDGADDRGDHILAALGHDGEDVAHEMHPAPLPGCALKHSPDRFLQPGAGIRHDQLHPVKATHLQRAEERGPEPFVFGFSDVETEDFPPPIRSYPDGDDDRLRDDPVIDTGFAVGRIKEHVRVVQGRQGPVPELRHLRIRARADPGHLGLRDPGIGTQRFDEVIDFPG